MKLKNENKTIKKTKKYLKNLGRQEQGLIQKLHDTVKDRDRAVSMLYDFNDNKKMVPLDIIGIPNVVTNQKLLESPFSTTNLVTPKENKGSKSNIDIIASSKMKRQSSDGRKLIKIRKMNYSKELNKSLTHSLS